MTLPGKRKRCCLYCGAELSENDRDFCSPAHRAQFQADIRKQKSEVGSRHPLLIRCWEIFKWAIRAASLGLIILSSIRLVTGSGDSGSSALIIGLSIGVLLCSFGLISRF